MWIRYKETNEQRWSNCFNTSAFSEVLTIDDTIDIKSVDVFIEAKQMWMSLSEAFDKHDVIVDDYNECFFEPSTNADRIRGYILY